MIAYSGQDVEKLANIEQVHASFGAPTTSGDFFEEYWTHRKISEPQVAGVDLLLGTGTLGLFEVWNFPQAILQTASSTLFGQTLRFVYDRKGDIIEVQINGTPMKNRAVLP